MQIELTFMLKAEFGKIVMDCTDYVKINLAEGIIQVDEVVMKFTTEILSVMELDQPTPKPPKDEPVNLHLTEYPQNVLRIPNATESTTDAAQYMLWKGVKQYNLCGEFCVAYCMRDETATDNIDDFLAYWEATDLKWWQTIFRRGLARTTGIYDLNQMLKAYKVSTPRPDFAKLNRTFDAFEEKLKTAQAIVGVKIDHTGYLVGSGIPHWVVLEQIEVINDQHAIVSIYNPFTNNVEPYSWREFMTSTGSYKQGIWIDRVAR